MLSELPPSLHSEGELQAGVTHAIGQNMVNIVMLTSDSVRGILKIVLLCVYATATNTNPGATTLLFCSAPLKSHFQTNLVGQRGV